MTYRRRNASRKLFQGHEVPLCVWVRRGLRFECGSHRVHIIRRRIFAVVVVVVLKGIIVKKLFQLITAAVAHRTPKRSESIRTSKERRQMEGQRKS